MKLSILSKYKYVIAFENSNNFDWMTEKSWHPLIARAVPITSAINVGIKFNILLINWIILIGFNSVRPEFVKKRIPDENSIIWLGDFDSVFSLARYLKGNLTNQNQLTDPHVFKKHTSWHNKRRCELNPLFQHANEYERGQFSSVCSICAMSAIFLRN